METNSRFCEVSTYAQSSGYNSSTASSSLNFIDEDHLPAVIPEEASCANQSDNIDSNSDQLRITRLIITITLVKFEKVRWGSKYLNMF